MELMGYMNLNEGGMGYLNPNEGRINGVYESK